MTERRPFDTTLQGLAALYSHHFLAWLCGTDVVWLQSLDNPILSELFSSQIAYKNLENRFTSYSQGFYMQLPYV